MGVTLNEIARILDGTLDGDPQLVVSSVRTPEEAAPGDICVVWGRDQAQAIASSAGTAFVTTETARLAGRNLIRVGDPQQCLITLLELLHPIPRPPAGVEPGAHVAADVRLAEDVFVAAGARVDAGTRLGPRVQVHANACVGADVEIGEDTIIHPNATILRGTRIGRRVVIHSGAVIGSDGFGYVRSADGRQRKIPHVGVVEIEDDVEIGAGTTIDRAVLGRTVIRRGTKIDNLVQIAHNTDIGVDCCIVAQAGIAGSSRVGDRAVIGAQVGISDHLIVGSGVRLGARSAVADHVASGDWIGSPALPAARARRVAAVIKRLPEIYDEVRALRRSCEHLARQLDGGEDDLVSREPPPPVDDGDRSDDS